MIEPDADAELAARKREMAERGKQALLADLVEVLKTAPGRRVLHRLMTDSGMHLPSHALGPDGRGDALATAFREGCRNQGLMIELLIGQADPDALIEMQTEHLKAVRAARAQRAAAEMDAGKQ